MISEPSSLVPCVCRKRKAFDDEEYLSVSPERFKRVKTSSRKRCRSLPEDIRDDSCKRIKADDTKEHHQANEGTELNVENYLAEGSRQASTIALDFLSRRMHPVDRKLEEMIRRDIRQFASQQMYSKAAPDDDDDMDLAA